MGKIKHILSEREIGPGFYSSTARLEIDEAIHFHTYENRLIWDKETFLKMVELFKEAEITYYKLGCPNTTEKMHLLAGVDLPKQLSHNRIGIEQQPDNKIHVHYKDLKIHINDGDLYVFCETFENAWLSMCMDHSEVVDIKDLKYHPVVDEYMEWLKEYKYTSENWRYLKRMITKLKSAVGKFSERNLGFPEGYPVSVDPKIQRRYLYALYKDITENDIQSPIVCYRLKDDSLQVVNSHRFAIEKFSGVNSINVVVIQAESNWKE